MDNNDEYEYMTEDEIWERFIIVRRIWIRYKAKEVQDADS